ncbi:MAG: GTP-binding protein [Myxococcales bacterium]
MAPANSPDQNRTPAAVPLILLTGFLGAGKTTLLNRVLAAQHHRRVAVLVNELGRIDIDAGLIRRRAGDVLELSGGCVCHQIGVQRELWSALDDIVARSRPEVVILETTGIAEPAAIWDGLAELTRERGEASGDDEYGDEDGAPASVPAVQQGATVTVVDAEAGLRQLERHEEARLQVVAADRILISKLDLAPVDRIGALHQRLHELNAEAERAAFPAGDAGTAALIPWFLDARRPEPPGRWRPDGAAPASSDDAPWAHAHQLAAAAFVDDAPLIGDALLLVCSALGEQLVRAKGFVHLAGEDRRGFLELAGDRLRLELGAAWGDEKPSTKLVLIGEGLDEAALQRQLWACRAVGAPP